MGYENWPVACYAYAVAPLRVKSNGEIRFGGVQMSHQSQMKITNLEDLIKQGENAFAQGQINEARQYFQRALDINPGYADALNNLAVLCHHSGDLDQAELLFLRASALARDPADALVNLSSVACQSGLIPESTGYLERALVLEGETPRILEQMSFLCDAMGDPVASAQLYRRARAASDSIAVSWRASFCEVDITPQLNDNVELQGYFGPSRVAERIVSPLKMQVLLTEDGFGKRALFVSADIFGFGPEMQRVVHQYAAIWGIEPAAVVLNASHTHYGPGTATHMVAGLGRFDHGFANRVCAGIGEALPALYQDLQSADLSFSQADSQIGFNRRSRQGEHIEMLPNPQGHYETATPTLLIKRADGRRLIMVNHGCHPTGLGAAAVICADYPGVMRDRLIERDAADVAMFFQGAAGDIKQGAQVGDKIGWIAGYEDVKILGQRLADDVISALGTLTPIEGPLRAVEQTIEAPLQATAGAEAELIRPENARVNREMLQNWAAVVDLIHPDKPTSLSYTLSCVSLGQALFVNMPCEPMAITAGRIRELSTRHDVVFTLGYTNGLFGYLPADEMIAEGGYEAHSSAFVYSLPSPFAEGVEHGILQGSYVGSMSVAPPVELPAEPEIRRCDHRAFFFLSTGRSGTQTLAEMLKMAENTNVWHHPQPYMIQETLHAYWDDIDIRNTFWAGRGDIVRQAWDRGLVHGETDHNMTPFCGEIARDIPNSRFVILVRDPREFVRSGMRRNYYRGGGEWEAGRLRPKEEDPRLAEWSGRSQFEQVCWLWAETYRHIERLRAEIGEDRIMVLRFEDLIDGPEATGALFDFLGLSGFEVEKARSILGQKLNAQQVGEFPHPAEWSDELHRICWHEVGEIAARYNYSEIYPKQRKVGAA